MTIHEGDGVKPKNGHADYRLTFRITAFQQTPAYNKIQEIWFKKKRSILVIRPLYMYRKTKLCAFAVCANFMQV